jgi:hypothetical protein
VADAHPLAFSTPRGRAYDAGEIRGPHFYVVTGGYLRRIGRLPDFLGGPVLAGGWLENGDAFQQWGEAGLRTNGGVGLVMDTLIGPAIIAGSWSFDGRWRTCPHLSGRRSVGPLRRVEPGRAAAGGWGRLRACGVSQRGFSLQIG